MVRLWKLPAAVVEFSVGTTIVIIHAALAKREQRRKQQWPQSPPWRPGQADRRAPADARPAASR